MAGKTTLAVGVMLAVLAVPYLTPRAERFRVAIESAPWPRRRVTASFGVAAVTPSMADGQALISAADAALYRAKQSGRNRVEWPGAEKMDETVVMLRPIKR